jgi:hypothetical protein
MMNRVRGADGFTVFELLVAMAITLTIAAALLDLTDRARGIFQVMPERADMHQRLRVAVDALARDLSMAGAGVEPLTTAPMMPYRVGTTINDADFGVLYRADAITVMYRPWGESTAASHTYYLKQDGTAGPLHLMHHDGAETDLPVVDHVVGLQFEYFGGDASPLEPSTFQDGPWVSADPDALPFDADLLNIRRVRVLLRVQAALDSMRGPSGVLFLQGGKSTSVERYVPDLQIQFDVALRNVRQGGEAWPLSSQ